jgi:hypothetical protein
LEAKRVLREDLDKGLEELIDPEDLWNFRDKYLMFPLDILGGHIYQELRGCNETG